MTYTKEQLKRATKLALKGLKIPHNMWAEEMYWANKADEEVIRDRKIDKNLVANPTKGGKK